MLVRENFIDAEKSFKAFIGEHPNDPLTSNAYYWLGETFYVRKNYMKGSFLGPKFNSTEIKQDLAITLFI